MRDDTLFPKPTFIAKLLIDGRPYAEQFATQEAFWVPANYVVWQTARRAVEAAQRGCHTLIIDPVTNNFSYDKFLDAPTYQALPYCPDDMLTAANFEDEGFRESFIRTVLRFQAEQGAGILLAPYLLAENLDSARYPINLRLATEAKDELNSMEDRRAYQLFAVINISSHFLASPASVARVSSDYLSLPAEGYILMVEGFDDRRASQDHLNGLADLVAQLSNERDVIVMPIAAFGLVLTALGANAFGAGVGWMEIMREQSLMSGQVGYDPEAAYRGRYYYLPELLYYAHPDQIPTLTDPEICPSLAPSRCACPECIDSIPEDVRGKRMHFLHRRYDEMTQLAHADPSQRKDWLESRIQVALELAPRVFQDTLIEIPTAHLQRWLRTLV